MVMAIYHFSAKVISRAAGSSAVASAAYRSASRLHDQRLDRHQDFSDKSGVVHSEVMLPEKAPPELADRERLWNAVEAGEVRKDAQLAREVEFAIPREMTQEQGIELARDFVRETFVDQGMIADLNVHWDIGEDGLARPHAHVMLTMRSVDENGFGAKVRDWNRTELLEQWREDWGVHVNERLAELGIDARIDHRSLEAQGIDLEPQDKIGSAAARMAAQGLEADRLEEHREIARENGARIIADPGIALDAITRQQATFTRRDLAMFVHRHSDGVEQFKAVLSAVEASPERIELGRDGRGEERFTTRQMLQVEERLHSAAERLELRNSHSVPEAARERAVERAAARGLVLSEEQHAALEHVTGRSDLGIVVGYAGTGKSAMLGVAADAFRETGYSVQGLALSGIAAENLEAGSGIPSRTVASLEHAWGKERDLLGPRDVLVIDEAGMIGSRQLERVLTEAERRGAKVLLVGDPEQLQSIEAGAAFRSLAERHPHIEIGDIRRQHESWQREATKLLATGRTTEALEAYDREDRIHAAETREDARRELIERWDRDRQSELDRSRLILAHTNEDVRDLNSQARARLRARGELGADISVKTERGARDFAPGDRVMFLRNKRGLDLKNGTLGLVEEISQSTMTARLDSGARVTVTFKDYNHLDHGYAATIHKAQGVTVDRTHVLASPGLDRHATYVALSRHRRSVDLHYGRDDFADQRRLGRVLSRERAKDMASDYEPEIRRGIVPEQPASARSMFAGFRPKPLVALEPAVTPEPPPLGAAVQRYARAAADIERMQERNLPVLPHQEAALAKATDRLNQIRPEAASDLGSAFAENPGLVRDAAEGSTQRALRAMRFETEIRHDPNKRADRFVSRWRGLDQQRTSFANSGDHGRAKRIADSMGAMAQGLHRDPQLESVLRNRTQQLGVGMQMDAGIGRNLMRYLGIGLGIGR
jgi:Ti-type conjugative transfer relaxase TraA